MKSIQEMNIYKAFLQFALLDSHFAQKSLCVCVGGGGGGGVPPHLAVVHY